MSWLFDWLFGEVIDRLGRAIHRHYGWGGCLSVLLVIAACAGLLIWWISRL